jgi:hypothetical protein
MCKQILSQLLLRLEFLFLLGFKARKSCFVLKIFPHNDAPIPPFYYCIKRLIKGKPTHFRKHNQRGVKSPVFRIVKIEIVDSPRKYLKEGVLHTEKAIKLYGVVE